MESNEFIRAKLVSQTRANCSDSIVSNNRYEYILLFERAVDWQWLYGEIQSVDSVLDVDLEMGEIRPSGVSNYEVSIRESDQRAKIDEQQHSLTSFEQKT